MSTVETTTTPAEVAQHSKYDANTRVVDPSTSGNIAPPLSSPILKPKAKQPASSRIQEDEDDSLYWTKPLYHKLHQELGMVCPRGMSDNELDTFMHTAVPESITETMTTMVRIVAC